TYSGALAKATPPMAPPAEGGPAEGGQGGLGANRAMRRGEEKGAAKKDEGFARDRLSRSPGPLDDRDARRNYANEVAKQMQGQLNRGRGVSSVATASQL